MLDRSAKTLIAIFTLVAGLLLAVNLAVDQAPAGDWVLAVVLLAVSIGFWVWLWQESIAPSSEVVVSESAAPPVAQEWIISKDPVAPPNTMIPPAKAPEPTPAPVPPKEHIPTELISEAKIEPVPPAEAELKAEVAPEEKAIVEPDPEPEAPARVAAVPVETAPEPDVPATIVESAPVETAPPARLESKIEVPPKEKTQVEPLAKSTSEEDEPDDLERIEGIGPKYRAALYAAGITKFDQIAVMTVPQIVEAVQGAGMRRASHMSTWAEQAALAANGDWDALNVLQGQLKGGRQA